MTLEEAIGEVLKTERSKSGLSQEELALRSELDRTYISLLERGQRKPTLNTLMKICCVLNIKTSNFVSQVENLMENNKATN